jgi:large subunit ribosomal protein L9
MKVILLSDLRQRGKRGNVIEVKPGYARNYLLPQGIALPATAGNIKYFEQQRKKIDARHVAERDTAAAIAAQLAGVKITIAKRVGEADTLYGSVTAAEIAAALAAKGFTVDRRRIDLEGGIKKVGEHPVRVELHPEVVAEVAVHVVAEAG